MENAIEDLQKVGRYVHLGFLRSIRSNCMPVVKYRLQRTDPDFPVINMDRIQVRYNPSHFTCLRMRTYSSLPYRPDTHSIIANTLGAWQMGEAPERGWAEFSPDPQASSTK